jgi:hypothetical protein
LIDRRCFQKPARARQQRARFGDAAGLDVRNQGREIGIGITRQLGEPLAQQLELFPSLRDRAFTNARLGERETRCHVRRSRLHELGQVLSPGIRFTQGIQRL